jgi:hypothetical protein
MLSCSCSSKSEPKELSKTSKLEAALGSSSYALIANADEITAFKVAPKLPGPGVPSYQPSSATITLTENASKELREALLNDASYHFDITKKCLFIPTLALVFSKGDESMSIYVSPACQQLKFLNGDKTLLLDYDPAHQLFENNFNHIHF